MRDLKKSIEYFDLLIQKRYESIKKSEVKISDNLIKIERLNSVRKNLSDKYTSLFQAKYSRGDNLFENIKEDYKNATLLMQEYWKENHIGINYYIKDGTPIYLKEYTVVSYLKILDLLALGVLIDDIDDTYFNLIVQFIENDDIKDYLFEFLINHKYPKDKLEDESYGDISYINERYNRLKNIIKIDDKDVASKELKYFLENEWYQSFKDTPLYNQHNNPHNTYVGYWCFVAAAIVKIKDLDDSSFRDNEFYPKDLLNYNTD